MSVVILEGPLLSGFDRKVKINVTFGEPLFSGGVTFGILRHIYLLLLFFFLGNKNDKNFNPFFLSDSIFGGDMLTHSQSSRESSPGLCRNSAAPKPPLFDELGKVVNLRDIPMVTVHDFTKFPIPPPVSFELEKISRIFPYPGAENLIYLLVFPDIFNLQVGPGSYPWGKPMTCALAHETCATNLHTISMSQEKVVQTKLFSGFLFATT